VGRCLSFWLPGLGKQSTLDGLLKLLLRKIIEIIGILGHNVFNMFSSMNGQMYSKSNPFLASIKERYSICSAESKKQTYHVVLDLKGSGITYNVGDSLAIYPTHDRDLVERTMKAMKATGEEKIPAKHSGLAVNLEDLLTCKLNITNVGRKLIGEIAVRQTNQEKQKHLQGLLEEENKDELKEFMNKHELWDLLSENEEALFSPQEVCNMLQPLLPRFYSIASSMEEVGEEVHLTVADLSYITNQHLRRGVCTYYLCELAPLHAPLIPVYVQPNHGFTLPSQKEADLIMIGPGTGIAPFRAFMQERMAKEETGKNWLFFGEWHREHQFFYKNYWDELTAKGKLRLELAFSRDQEHKIYVWHRMLEHAKEVFEWIQKGAYIFVCGDAHRMAKDVDAALHEIVKEQGAMDELSAKNYVKKLRKENRYLRDVY
jgi:sulfite reductase (NADPH) flavoprotein alpha-component